MFKKSSLVSFSSSELERFIEDSDIFNSEFLYKLSSPDIEKEEYVIKKGPYRPDLIAEDYYRSSKYESFVIFLAGGMDNLTIGNTIRLVPLSSLEYIVNSI